MTIETRPSPGAVLTAAIESSVRAAMLTEAAEWTGDLREHVFKAFESLAQRMHINITLSELEAEAEKTRNAK